MVGAGALHFVIPRSYQRIVPRFLGHAPLLVVVWPANVQMALDGGIPGAGFPTGSPVVAWLRVPLQAPLVVWALRLARRAPRPGAALPAG